MHHYPRHPVIISIAKNIFLLFIIVAMIIITTIIITTIPIWSKAFQLIGFLQRNSCFVEMRDNYSGVLSAGLVLRV